jgi:hypothetical protein
VTEGQHSHDELRQEIDGLKAELAKRNEQGDAVTQEAAQAAVNAQQAAEVAVTEAAVTRADLESLRDELTSRLDELKAAPERHVESTSGPEPSGVPAAPVSGDVNGDIAGQPPASEGVEAGEPDMAPAPGDEEGDDKPKRQPPSRKRKSVWWG